jgi:acetyl esterase/lipase
VLAFLAAAGALAAVLGEAPDRVERRENRPPTLERRTVGGGERAAAIVTPGEPNGPLPLVIFLHGWGQVGERDYGPWIDHLARRGNAVVVPQYQRSLRARPDLALGNALAGIRAALAEIDVVPGSLVVAGHSAGGALAADYAATAATDPSLPRPRAVFAVYPGRAIKRYPGGIPPVDPEAIPADTELVAMAGAEDRVVGEGPARELLLNALQVPPERSRFVRVSNRAVNDHRGPERASGPARKVFWARLNRLLAAVRRSG